MQYLPEIVATLAIWVAIESVRAQKSYVRLAAIAAVIAATAVAILSMFDIGTLIFGVIPMNVWGVLAGASIRCVVLHRTAMQALLALFVVGGALFSEAVLLAMMRGAWPTFLPHLLLVPAVAALVLQRGLLGRRKSSDRTNPFVA